MSICKECNIIVKKNSTQCYECKKYSNHQCSYESCNKTIICKGNGYCSLHIKLGKELPDNIHEYSRSDEKIRSDFKRMFESREKMVKLEYEIKLKEKDLSDLEISDTFSSDYEKYIFEREREIQFETDNIEEILKNLWEYFKSKKSEKKKEKEPVKIPKQSFKKEPEKEKKKEKEPEKEKKKEKEPEKFSKECLKAFKILELPPTLNIRDIKCAYIKLGLILHPDKSKLPNATELFQDLSNAYSYLIENL